VGQLAMGSPLAAVGGKGVLDVHHDQISSLSTGASATRRGPLRATSLCRLNRLCAQVRAF
jgi:hypothetical protein